LPVRRKAQTSKYPGIDEAGLERRIRPRAPTVNQPASPARFRIAPHTSAHTIHGGGIARIWRPMFGQSDKNIEALYFLGKPVLQAE